MLRLLSRGIFVKALVYTRRMTRAELQAYKLSDEPGVYFFHGKDKKVLYIGKATSLRDRVRSYFGVQLANARSNAIVKMVEEARSISYKATGSVLEALILEANLIKKHQPPYNVDEKDNKSFNYVVVTKENFPRILLVRGRELFQNYGFRKPIYTKHVFGPFPEDRSLKEALKIIRKIFPYRDKCSPPVKSGSIGKQISGFTKSRYRDLRNPDIKCRPCFNRQLGLCPGVCSGEISQAEYAKTVKNIHSLFSGNFMGLKRRLAKEMHKAAQEERFENATAFRRQIIALEHIRDVSLIKGERISSGGGARIEAFDVAHTSGSETVAVMVVVNSGEMIRAAYRKFKITTATNDDIAALKEAFRRRLNHPAWPLPRVFVVDGGLGQIRVVQRVSKEAGITIPIVGVVKNAAHKPERLIGDKRAIEAYEQDILLANSEAHRYGIAFHRKRRARAAF